MKAMAESMAAFDLDGRWVTRRTMPTAGWAFVVATFMALAHAVGQTPAEVDKKVSAIAADWESLPSVFDDIDVYAEQIKELTEIGKPAVPGLIAALERTFRDTPMRLLAFTLRAIGDARAVPALIRALPKTLLPPGSDCAMSVADAEVKKFMLSNDLFDGTGDRLARRNFDMGRPVREVSVALRKITGTNLNEVEIFMTFLSGGDQQRALERKAFNNVARRWAEWWKGNWNRFVDDATLADVGLPALQEEPGSKRFLTGPNIKASEGEQGMIVSPVEDRGGSCCLVLGLNRVLGLPKALLPTNAAPDLSEKASLWAARTGVDLMGTKHRDGQSGKTYYCLRAVGLHAWEIPNEDWARIDEELQHGTLPALDSPAGDLLMHYDPAQDRYFPQRRATFLFITRDGSQGILRVTAQVTRHFTARDMGMPAVATDETSTDQAQDAGHELGVKLDYKLFYEETDALKAEARARKEMMAERNKVRKERKMSRLFEMYPHLTGTVYLPGGQLASNAAVLLRVEGEASILGARRFELTDQATMVHTLVDGSFDLPHVSNAHVLYVAHDEGFREVSLDGAELPLAIHLAPWGRIKGTLTLESKPAPKQKVGLLNGMWAPGVSRLSLSPGTFTTETDEQGRFTFEGLPPGEVQVCRMVNHTYFEAQFVEVSAGKTTRVQHGFNGRLLKGQLVASDGTTNVGWNGGRFTFATKSTPPEPPSGEDGPSWLRQYWQSPEGRARQRETHHFAVTVDAQGAFLIDDVAPGTYELSGDLHEGSGNSFFPTGKTLGRLKQDVVVPESAGSDANQPLDLGSVRITMVNNLKAGDLAPDFQVKTIDGASLRLSDFRGKYVLLDFWATWCGPCRGETPNLKAVYEAYGKKPQFAMIGLSLDPSADAPRDYTRKEGISWHQAFLGDWSKATLPSQYGVEGIPAIFLVDPKGKILATDLRGPEIAKALAAALGKR